MRARASTLALPVLLCLPALAPAAGAQAVIEAVDGTVTVAPAGMKARLTVTKPPYALKAGDQVRTEKGASAALSFPDHSRAQLGEESDLSVDKTAAPGAAFTLDAGVLKSWLTNGLSRRYRVATPTAVVEHGTQFSVQVTPTQDTQVEVDRGAASVRIKNGERTVLGPDQAYRSLLVLPGRSLSLLPHPREEGLSAKKFRRMRDCLHKPNGALRGSVEEIEACQNADRDKRDQSPAEARLVREHERAELRVYLQATGVLPVGGDDRAQAADDSAGQGAESAASDGRNKAAESDALMKELGLSDATTASPLAGMSPEKIKALQAAMAAQGSDPALQNAFSQVAGGKKQLSPAQMNSLLQSLHLDQLKLPASGKSAAPADP
jgi:hypothetical protein